MATLLVASIGRAQGIPLDFNIIQNGIAVNNEKVVLKPAVFELDFMIRPYVADDETKWFALQLAATTNQEDLKYLTEGPLDMDNPFFGIGGTGLASDGIYPELFLEGYGHHYIVWQEDGEQRANLIECLPNDRILLSWNIDQLWYNEKAHPMSDPGIKQFYLMVLFDENLNEVVEPGEYRVLSITIQ